jgi:signal transduction histidine kinase
VRWHRSPRAVDAALTAAVLVASVTEVLTLKNITGPRWANALLVAAWSLPLLWRRTHPVAAASALVVMVVPATLWVIDATEYVAAFFSLLILAYGGGRYADRRSAAAVLALLLGAVVAVALAGENPDASDVYFPGAIVTLCWVGGRTVRVRLRHAAELHEAAALAAEQHELEARQAVADERRRIAREMHDVVAHSISIMVVQAGGARRILATDPERAEHAGARIRHAGSDALAEMDILLGVLETVPQREAQPGLDGLDDLVARTREAGLPVTLEIEGVRRPLPAGAEAAVYRVVQEALTNAIKHAGGATTRVLLAWGADVLEIRVVDDGDGGPSPRLTGAGHGLIGMQERIRVHGGDVEAGPRVGGGFQVVARLPLEREKASVE